MDLLPLVNHIRRRLTVSHGILADALPSHVVTAMLRDGQKRQQEKEAEEVGGEELLVVASLRVRNSNSNTSVSGAGELMKAVEEEEEEEEPAGGLGEMFQQLLRGLGSIGGKKCTEEVSHPEVVTLVEEHEAASTPLWPITQSSPQLSGLSGLLLEAGCPLKVQSPPPPFITTAERRGRTASECGGMPFIPRRPLLKTPATSLGSSPRNRDTVSMNGKPGSSSSAAAACSAGGQLMVAHHECVTIFFSDICGFSTWAHRYVCGSWFIIAGFEAWMGAWWRLQ